MISFRENLHVSHKRAVSTFLFFIIYSGQLPLLTYSQHQLKLHWWAHPPYTSESNTSTSGMDQMSGLIPHILKEILPLCNISVQANQTDYFINVALYSAPLDFHRESHLIIQPINDSHTDVFFPVVRNRKDEYPPFVHPSVSDPRNLAFIPIITSPGAVHFYKMDKEPVANDLLNVILQGWPMLILIMLGAGYSGIMIWLLDRLWNDSHFPKPFLKGFWEGFWWAFVTMTTVGYGDTTPRSIQARIFGLVWIVVGVTILSVFTATVTTVLTQETLGVHHRLQGQKIGIIQGSEEFPLLVRGGGQPIVARSFSGLVDMLGTKEIVGALYDQYGFASYQDELSEQYLVHKLIPNEVDHGILLHSTDSRLRACFQQQGHNFRWLAFKELSDTIPALTTKTASAAENAQSLFQPKTITYMWYGGLIWLVVFFGFVIWEFCYWRPKHRRRQAIKIAILKSRLGHPSGDRCLSGAQNEVPNVVTMDLDARGNINQNPPANVERQLNVPPVDGKPSRKLQNGFVGNKIPSARFFANQGFDGTGDPDSVNEVRVGRSHRSNSHSEVTSLEVLIKRQKEDLARLEEELVNYQNQWTQRVKDMRRQHREERKKMLRLIDHDELFRNDTQSGNLTSVSEYYYHDPEKLNNEDNFDQSNSSANPAALGVYEL